LDRAIIAQLLLIAGAIAGGRALTQRNMRRLRERQRRTYEESYDPTIEPRLAQYAEQVSATFGAALFAHPAVDAPLVANRNPTDFVRETVALTASRFAIQLPEIEARFVSVVPRGAPAVVVWDGEWDVKREGTVFRIRRRADASPNWRILIQERHRYNDKLLTVIVAHEVAHIALLSRGVRLPLLRDNEELTDAAAVLAGFGPLMRQVSFEQSQHECVNGQWSVSASRVGYLHRRAIDALMHYRARWATV
jgi:hypothetical protein